MLVGMAVMIAAGVVVRWPQPPSRITRATTSWSGRPSRQWHRWFPE
jgi:hypothetical protein